MVVSDIYMVYIGRQVNEIKLENVTQSLVVATGCHKERYYPCMG